MKCHLADIESLSESDLDALEQIESLHLSDRLDLCVQRCSQCGQLYLTCFVEYVLGDGDNDHWNFWAPISEEEFMTAKSNHRAAVEMIISRRRICWGPSGKIYWKDGPEFVLS